MQEEKYREYLKDNEIEPSLIDSYIESVKKFDSFLKNELQITDIDSSFLYHIRSYLRSLKMSTDEKNFFLNALKNYGLSINKKRMVTNVNVLLGQGTWLTRLSDTLDEFVDEDIRTEIMTAGGPIEKSSTANKKAKWTKCMMDCLEANVDEETCKKILTNNLHYKNPKAPSIKKLKKMYEKTSIDDVLDFLHNKWKTYVGDRFGYDSPEYKFVANDRTIESGKRDGNIIYVSKIPFKLKEYINAKDEKEKRFNYCHCGWVRASIQKSNDEEISHNFCYCSGGWHKIPFETIFGQSLEVDIVKTVLKGDDLCTFAIHIPEDINLETKEK
ncbi:MAG: hypothetical protein FK730_09450 [Asgard group archaeon]|nr:hypothetical protein [Asgard group archaeon]